VTLREIGRLMRAAAAGWIADSAPRLGAALAYYTLFSIAPLLLILVSIAGLVFGEDAARGEIIGQLRELMGEQGASAVQGLLQSVSKPAEGIVSALIGFAVLLLGATTVLGELQAALDHIWRAPPPERGGLWKLLRTRLLSFGLILGLGFLLIVSLVTSAALAAAGRWWSAWFGGWLWLLEAVNAVAGFALMTAVFALIFKLMPRVRVQWRDVWIGAAATSLLFAVGKSLIGLYIGRSGVASGFGAAGSLVAVLVWIYWSAQVFLLGAEFTHAYAQAHGSLSGGAAAQDGGAADRSAPTPP
jgi:membrane protein